MFNEKGTIWSHEALSKDVLLLEVSAPQIAASAKPGQFVHVKINENMDPLLRRPISINKVAKEQGRLWLLYQIRGRGTKELAKLREGDALDIMGPIGNGFDLSADKAPFLLIGGGMGMAPFSFVARYLYENNLPWKAVLGACTQKELFTEKDFSSLGNLPVLATDDGSVGIQGTSVQAAERILAREQFKTILACGPTPMLKAVALLADNYGIQAQLSLEARMACGVGACLGCTVKKAISSGYYKVCKDGPVFNAAEVNLDA